MNHECGRGRAEGSRARGRVVGRVLAAAGLLIGLGCGMNGERGGRVARHQDVGRVHRVEGAVIYEVFVRNFTPEGTFGAVIPKLPELKAMGVTTLWLMPIHPISAVRRKGTYGSPYAIADYRAIHPDLGTEADFRALVDAVHAQGMHLLIDFVANHTGWDHVWVRQHPEWYTRDRTGAITHPAGTDWLDVADLDYSNPALRQAMKDVLLYWVQRFDVDGFRCDVAEMVPLDFWEEAIRALRAVKPVVMLAEGADPALHRAGFDLTYSWTVYQAVKAVWRGAPADTLRGVLAAEQARYPEGAHRVRFTTNHDETAWDNPPPILFNGEQGARAAAVLSLLLPGVPLIYNGQESGSAVKTSLFEKQALDLSGSPEMHAFYRKLLAVRRRWIPLQDGTVAVLPATTQDVFVYERRSGAARVLVAVNVRNRPSAVMLPEVFRGGSVQQVFGTPVAGDGARIVLPAYGYALLGVE